MKNYDIESMMEVERKRNAFYQNEQIRISGKREIADVTVDLIYKNKNCAKACGNRVFKASQFVRFEKNGMVFKREQDAEETFIRNCWMKNADDVERFARRNFTIEEPKADTRRMHYSEYKNSYAECKTVKGSYDSVTKTIEVIIG